MHSYLRIVLGVSAATLIGVAAPVFAESAPVFDADSMQQSFDGDAMNQGQELAPPASEGAFVPNPSNPPASQPNVAIAPASTSPSASVTSAMSLDQRMRRAEQQISNIQSSESSAKIESLQDQIQSLRGQVEQLSHQLQQVQSQQKTLSQSGVKVNKKAGANDAGFVAADNQNDAPAPKAGSKIAAAKTSAKTIVADDTSSTDDSAKKSAEGQPNVAEEQEIYQTAYNFIKAKKYNEAVDALQGMLKKYPSGQFASNAHYWLGELYGLMGKNDQALTEFDTVVGSYPDSPRVSDAQLKVGLIYSAQSKWSDAKTSFKKVINHYPGTASARVASEQLKQIKTAGH